MQEHLIRKYNPPTNHSDEQAKISQINHHPPPWNAGCVQLLKPNQIVVSVLDFTRIEESWRHKRSMTMALGRCHAQGQPSRRHCGNLAKYWKVAVVVTFLTQNICSQPVLRKDGQIFACVCNPTYQIGVLLCCLGVWEGGSLAKLHGCPVELRDIEF